MGLFWREVAPNVFAHTFEPHGVNSYAIVGSGGVVVVDSGNSVAQGQLLFDESVTLASELTTGHVLALVNTHAHFDHCYGNEAFSRARVPIIEHGTIQAHDQSHALSALGRQLTAHPLPAAHTTSDLLIHIEDADVWITGDLVEESGPLNIETDSNTVQWASILKHLHTHSNASTVFLPGHGNPASQKLLGEHLEVLLAAGDSS